MSTAWLCEKYIDDTVWGVADDVKLGNVEVSVGGVFFGKGGVSGGKSPGVTVKRGIFPWGGGIFIHI